MAGQPEAMFSAVYTFGTTTRYPGPKIDPIPIQAFRYNFQFTENLGDGGTS